MQDKYFLYQAVLYLPFFFFFLNLLLKENLFTISTEVKILTMVLYSNTYVLNCGFALCELRQPYCAG